MDDKKLIKKIKERDQDGLLAFVDKYGPSLKGAIYPILRPYPDLLGEVLNESLLAIWDNIDSYDPGRSSLKNWSALVAKYKAIDTLRREIRHQSENLDQIKDQAFEDSYPFEDADEIKNILSYLKTEDQEIFIKLFLQGYSYDDLESLTGLSKDILYNRVSRGKSVLRKNLKGGKSWKIFMTN